MAIKVTVGEQKTQNEKPFPKLMIARQGDKKTIIFAEGLINGLLCGMCLYSNRRGDVIGEYSKTWSLHAYIDYNEPITLQNEA